ncbi:uncharacterized protein LOC119100673, partial [Pollicipes pollicipes]|uniref:uncharacterized protein LOC119100673 n=1 Tax=Pollicipes pollicipes TaxID=41117 RepID=UPI0018857D90
PARHFAPVVTLDAAGRVQDTPEVKAAKQAFDQAFRSAAAAAEAAPDVNIITGAAPASRGGVRAGLTYGAPAIKSTYLAPAVSVVPAGPVVTLDAEGRVEDTPEVKAAKLAFERTYATAAAAAAAAPDTGIITAPASSVRGSARGKAYYSGAKAAHHGATQTYSFDGVTVMQADGASSPGKFGYTYQ